MWTGTRPRAKRGLVWRIPFLLSVLVLIVGVIIRREVEETPAFREEQAKHTTPTAPVREVLTNHSPDLLRVMCMALMNVIPVVATIFGAAYAVQPGYGFKWTRASTYGFRSSATS